MRKCASAQRTVVSDQWHGMAWLGIQRCIKMCCTAIQCRLQCLAMYRACLCARVEHAVRGWWSTESAEDLYDRRAAVEHALEMLDSGIAF